MQTAQREGEFLQSRESFAQTPRASEAAGGTGRCSVPRRIQRVWSAKSECTEFNAAIPSWSCEECAM